MSVLRLAVAALSSQSRRDQGRDLAAQFLGRGGRGGDDARDAFVGLPLDPGFAFGCSGSRLLRRHHARHLPPAALTCVGNSATQILSAGVTETGPRRGTNQVEAQGLTTIMKESR